MAEPKHTGDVPQDQALTTTGSAPVPDLPVHHAPQVGTERPKILTPEQIRRIGALQVEDERVQGITDFLLEQRRVYRDNYSKEELIEALLDRDRTLALEGRQLADGRIQGRLLREFVRATLNMADHTSLRNVNDGSKAAAIERLLLALGAEPADLRQIKQDGTTLGSADREDKAVERTEQWKKGEEIR